MSCAPFTEKLAPKGIKVLNCLVTVFGWHFILRGQIHRLGGARFLCPLGLIRSDLAILESSTVYRCISNN